MKIALMGNPNSGKTTLYNVLTEDQEYIGNYAKVTANKKEAKLKENLGNNIDIIELPDVYSIREYTSKESITRDFIKAENPDVIINIVYSTNLNRSLFLTTQLIELNIPVVVALNKVDISKDVMDIDINKLEENLACKVVEISLSKNEGLENLITQAIESSKLKSQECLFENLLNIQSEKEQDKERYNIVNNIISKVENRKIIENEETLEDNIDKFVTNPIIKIGLFILIVVLIISLGFKGVTITTAFIEEKRQEQIENQKKIKAERLEEEIKRKESEEAKKRMVGVVHEARKYTYDAIKIQQRLDNYDYSNNGDKIVFLTFDDGSSTTVTQQILKTLKEHDVRATFFVTGQTIESILKILKYKT